MSSYPMGTYPEGRRIETPTPGAAAFGGLPDATSELLALARRHWPEARADDFEFDGSRAVDRASGEAYQVTTEWSCADAHPEEASISAFCIRDGKLVLLRTCGPRPSKTVQAARSYGGHSTRRGEGRKPCPGEHQ